MNGVIQGMGSRHTGSMSSSRTAPHFNHKEQMCASLHSRLLYCQHVLVNAALLKKKTPGP